MIKPATISRELLIGCCITLLVPGSCRDKYNSPVHAPVSGFLVVEGYISNDTAPTIIHLTRSVRLDSIHTVPEPGAAVMIETKNGDIVTALTESSPGYYKGSIAAIDPGEQYRLHIITSNRKDYLSGYSSPRNTPPIDSLNWSTYADGVKIYVSTHDPTGQAQNYHWEYDETWKYTAAYNSTVMYTDPYFSYRDSAHQVYVCYQTGQSQTIIVATSAGLAKDEISNFTVADISYRATNRLSSDYSINVRQRAMSKEALNYYQILSRNTQQLGSIFDAQPSALSGNVHAVSDPGELVLGFIECSAKTEKRIFVSRNQLPAVDITTGHGDCGILKESPPLTFAHFRQLFRDSGYIPLSGTATDTSYTGTYVTVLCGDCRAQGGTTTKPSFWP